MAAGTDFVLDALIREGLDHLFMVPGGLVDPFLPALARHPDLKPIVAAHEGGAAYMADGYARANGRLSRIGGGDERARNGPGQIPGACQSAL
jgi:acetolactate synthase-1/2/3 large subunit